ncbi:hypothetical protein IM543_04510 [Massilia sp. UMI-21]|nr:hypothetical protein IM543_04510 [Massilia sp. UMI-21]
MIVAIEAITTINLVAWEDVAKSFMAPNRREHSERLEAQQGRSFWKSDTRRFDHVAYFPCHGLALSGYIFYDLTVCRKASSVTVRPLPTSTKFAIVSFLRCTALLFKQRQRKRQGVDELSEALHNLASLLLTNTTLRTVQQGSTE